MSILLWFTDLFNESPPEPLVLGAEFKCLWGTSHSYLFVDSDNIDINNLPQANVEDCIAFYNIAPFGKYICQMGQPCESFLIGSLWESVSGW